MIAVQDVCTSGADCQNQIAVAKTATRAAATTPTSTSYFSHLTISQCAKPKGTAVYGAGFDAASVKN
jgi:hypothetical protein